MKSRGLQAEKARFARGGIRK